MDDLLDDRLDGSCVRDHGKSVIRDVFIRIRAIEERFFQSLLAGFTVDLAVVYEVNDLTHDLAVKVDIGSQHLGVLGDLQKVCHEPVGAVLRVLGYFACSLENLDQCGCSRTFYQLKQHRLSKGTFCLLKP